MTSEIPRIFIFTALPCEARPFVDRLGLKKAQSIRPFDIYAGGFHCLTVTGIGKAAMTAGVAYTLGLFNPTDDPIMVNIGIAGHQTHNPGEIFIADKIRDADSGRNFYPPLIYRAPCRTTAVMTFSRPQERYRPDCLLDMEASAFYETAARFTSAELAQVMKVISDNETTPASGIQPARVAGWMEAKAAVAEQLIRELEMLRRPEETRYSECMQYYLGQWRFSVSEQNRLRKLLSNYSALNGGRTYAADIGAFKSAKEFLSGLERAVEQDGLSMTF
ncbi:MAG: 5'-methylthioadenosine/S-adenosylhomocysteine nucleosidase family protein [Gammaproteobacteria bacterium]